MCARKLIYNDKLITEQYTAQEKAEHKERLDSIKEQTNIDVSNYVEEKTSKSRTYLGVHLEKMPINQRNTIKRLMAQKGVRIEDNGGYGNAIYYKKKK